MPKVKINYQNGMIYKLVCLDPTITEKYIGSTTDFNNRKYNHKYVCNTITYKHYNCPVYKFIREHGGWNNWQMILIEKWPCNDGNELRARERHYYELYGGELNYCVPTQTPQESIKLYFRKNKEKIIDWKNSNNICIVCGGKYTNANKAAHNKSKRHLASLKPPEPAAEPQEPLPVAVA
jgi:hypothetical protein